MRNRSVEYAPAPILLFLVALVSVHSFAPCASAQEKPIYSFTGGADGNIPGTGVILDKRGNLYGNDTERRKHASLSRIRLRHSIRIDSSHQRQMEKDYPV